MGFYTGLNIKIAGAIYIQFLKITYTIVII